MKPKEKAKELVQENLYKIIELSYAETKSKELAIQTSLICVKHILELLALQIGFYDDEAVRYFKKVQYELNNFN